MRAGNIHWVNAGVIIGYHALLLITLPIYLIFFAQSLGLWITMLILVICCGLSITTLYHRYYSHKAYKLHRAAEIPILFFGTLSMQGSVLKWSHDHRLHHQHVDTDKDPYSINKGFWYAHCFWLFEKSKPMDLRIVQDLTKNKLVMFQHKHYAALVWATSLVVVGLFGWLFNDLFGAFVLLFLLRLFINHHTTWFINSLAHTWGVQPFSKEHSAVNNWVISLLTYGEGYHNYHHTFASDYRNGVRWYQFDPTKLLILGLSKVGLATNLRKVDRALITKKLVQEDKQLLLQRLKQASYVKLELLEKEITRRADALTKKLSTFNQLRREYKASKRLRAKHERKTMRQRIKTLRKSIRVDLRAWTRLCDNVLSLKPSLA